jgi:uncharacterized protein (DUF697 family)
MTQDQEQPDASRRSAAATQIIRTHAIAAVAAGILPIPLVGVAIMGGVHLRMIRQLALLYEVEFSEQRANTIIGSLLGMSATGAGLSLLGAMPVLRLLGGLTLPSASTYALGKVFAEHFESGGTFLTFDPARAKKAYADKLAEKRAEESYAGIKP